jgi:hypothetical protein
MNKSHLIGTPCPICKATFQESCNRGEVFCSSYCEGATKEEIEEFLKAKPGEYCIYPCPECRTAIEGELPVEGEPGAGCCSDCSRTIQVREQKKLLEHSRFSKGPLGPSKVQSSSSASTSSRTSKSNSTQESQNSMNSSVKPCGFSLVILWEVPESVFFFRVPSDHPLLPSLRTAAKKRACVNDTDCSKKDTKVILEAFYGGDEGDMALSPLHPFRVPNDPWYIQEPSDETIMLGFAL